jgi:hypothetical protein
MGLKHPGFDYLWGCKNPEPSDLRHDYRFSHFKSSQGLLRITNTKIDKRIYTKAQHSKTGQLWNQREDPIIFQIIKQVLLDRVL